MRKGKREEGIKNPNPVSRKVRVKGKELRKSETPVSKTSPSGKIGGKGDKRTNNADSRIEKQKLGDKGLVKEGIEADKKH